SATQFGKSNACDSMIGVRLYELRQACFDVFQFRRVSPVSLRRKVQNPFVIRFVEPQVSYVELLPFAEHLIPLEHLWKCLFERESNSLPHHADGIHRVHQHLSWRLEQV